MKGCVEGGGKRQSSVSVDNRVKRFTNSECTTQADPMAQLTRVAGSVGLITLQNPPVNALR